MSKVPAKTSTAALSTAVAASLETGLANALDQTSRDAGDMGLILKMTKSGEWIYGADEIEVEDGSLWAVNPLSFQIGYVCWIDGSGEPPEEAMAYLNEEPVDASSLPKIEGSKRGWQRQMAVDIMCVSGEDEGTQVRYSVSSKGGLKAMRTLLEATRKQVAEDSSKIVPVVQLDSSWYKHKEYGRIYNPIFDIQKFIPMDAYEDYLGDDDEDEEKDEPPKATGRGKGKAKAEPDPESEPEQGADEPDDEPAPRRRRRRPAAD